MVILFEPTWWMNDQDAKTGPKVLTSEWAKRLGAVDPKMQVSASQLGGQGQYEPGESSRRPRRRVMSQILINNY